MRFTIRAFILVLCIFPLMATQTAAAANTIITGGTNGPDCSSGGYFTPSSVTVNSGDTITISVPASDPYAGGIQVHGFPEGNFVVLPGNSHTTTGLTSSVSYYGTWPNTGCMKGSGTITVSVPAPPPPAPVPVPAPAPTPPAPPPVSKPAPTISNTEPTQTTPSPPTPAPSTPTLTNPPVPVPAGDHVTTPLAASASPHKRQSFSPTATVLSLGGGILIACLSVFGVWYLVIRKRVM